VGAFEAGLEVRKQFMSAEARAFLYAYVMCPEEPQVHRDNKLSSSFALRDYVKSIRTGVVQLIETQIPKFHPRLQGAKGRLRGSAPILGFLLPASGFLSAADQARSLRLRLPAGLAPLPAALAAETGRPVAARLGLGFVYVQCSSAEFRAVESGYSLIRLCGIAHFHKCKSAGAPSVAIGHHADPIHGTIRFK